MQSPTHVDTLKKLVEALTLMGVGNQIFVQLIIQWVCLNYPLLVIYYRECAIRGGLV